MNSLRRRLSDLEGKLRSTGDRDKISPEVQAIWKAASDDFLNISLRIISLIRVSLDVDPWPEWPPESWAAPMRFDSDGVLQQFLNSPTPPKISQGQAEEVINVLHAFSGKTGKTPISEAEALSRLSAILIR